MSPADARPRLAFIGLGNMGLPMATRLLAEGYELSGFDLAEAARAGLEANGGRTAATTAAAADGCDILVLMLPNSDVVEAVMLDEGMLAALRPGTIVVDMSSSEPLRTRVLAERLAERGIRFIDAPVSGGVVGAERGTLTIMVGGEEPDVQPLLPMFGILGRPTHVGPVGAGHAAKALNNLLSATHLWITSEAVLAGERFGLDPAVLLEVFNGSSGRSGSTQNKWPNFILNERYDSGFGLRLMLKDMRIATGLAAELGIPSLLGEQAVERWALAAGDLPATADHTEVARWLRDHSDGGDAHA